MWDHTLPGLPAWLVHVQCSWVGSRTFSFIGWRTHRPMAMDVSLSRGHLLIYHSLNQRRHVVITRLSLRNRGQRGQNCYRGTPRSATWSTLRRLSPYVATTLSCYLK